MLRYRLLSASLALAVLAAACGGSDADESSPPEETTAATVVPATDPPAPETTVVPTTEAPVPETTEAPADPVPYEGYVSEQYADGQNWLCHPEAEVDICDTDLDITQVNADGTTELLTHVVADNPEVDCFYLYPTVSDDPTGNADLDHNDSEQFTVINQFARYSSVCRLFAPVYRQLTVANLLGNLPEGEEPGDRELAEGDVLDAWKHYMANDNDGRPVLLVGHSQGTGWLTTLLRDEIVPDPVQVSQLVSAHLIGTGPDIAVGADTADGFGSVTLCVDRSDTGCFVSFGSFREGTIGDASFFRVDDGYESSCVNPADPSSTDPVDLNPVFPIGSLSTLRAVLGEPIGPFDDPARIAEIETPYYSMPGFLSGSCVAEGAVNYLSVSANADPNDPRADDFLGEMSILPTWGLHLIDMTLTIGDLVDMAAAQAEAFVAG